MNITLSVDQALISRTRRYAKAHGKTLNGMVRDYMTSENLVVAHPGEDIVGVAQDMLRQNKRRRPVVEDGKLIGQITIRQLLKAVREFRAVGG